MFALDADLEELNGVSFDKGCYVGQELTARMKHRGTARKKLLPVESSAPSLPEAGTPITAAGSEIGAITSVYDGRDSRLSAPIVWKVLEALRWTQGAFPSAS